MSGGGILLLIFFFNILGFMKNIFLKDFRFGIAAILLLSFFMFNCDFYHGNEKHSVLVFSKTAGYHHKCIARGNVAIMKLCEKNGIHVDTTTNPSFFNKENLSKYDAVIFFNTTGDVLDKEQELAFKQFIQSGNGYVGVHSASDTEYEWEWYGNLVGAYFVSHPKIQEARFVNKNPDFPGIKTITDNWIRRDEIYNFKIVNKEVNVILTVDESTYEGGINGKNHPMAWYHEYDGGRAFYTALGHTNESYSEALFLKHLLGGIQYAIGSAKVDH